MTQVKHKLQSVAALAKLQGLAHLHNVTQVQIAEKIGIRPQTVGQMFSGKFHPTLDNVYRALNAVNEISRQKYTLADIDPGEA